MVSSLTNNVTQFTGYIHLLNVQNTQEVKFASKTLHSASYKYIGYVEAIDCDFYNSLSEYSPISDISYSKMRITNTIGKQRRNI